MGIPELYFQKDVEWYDWLLANHNKHKGVYIIFYKFEMNIPTMRWEDAVKVALCFGWIDSTVKSLGNGKRRQYFSPRNPKSPWSTLNKKYVAELMDNKLMQQSGLILIETAKKNGMWNFMDDVENLIIPKDLQSTFDQNQRAFENFNNFARTYRKSYLSWLKQAKREDTRTKRIDQIIKLCKANKKTR